MIRVSASLSKKVPLPGVEFSSQQFGASLEVEAAAGESAESLRAMLKDLYALLNQTVDEQIAAVGSARAKAPAPQTPAATQAQWQGRGGNGNGQPRRRIAMATQAQQRAITRICEAQGLDVRAMLAESNAASPAHLTIQQASRLIDKLKARCA